MKLLIGPLLLVFSLSLYAESNEYGIGAMLGNPTGLNVKRRLPNGHAIDGGFGMSFGQHDEASLHSDYLFQEQGFFIFNDKEPLDLYYGLGGRMEFADTIELGLRIPVGIAHEFQGQRSDMFGEIAPIIDVVGKTGLEFHLIVGARYYF